MAGAARFVAVRHLTFKRSGRCICTMRCSLTVLVEIGCWMDSLHVIVSRKMEELALRYFNQPV